jgi:TMEM175 potassium channel family protein
MGRREGGSAVSTDRDTRARRARGTDRMKAFSDGVFSIAATLLVLDLAVHPPGTPLQQVLHAWPGYVAYLVSFLTIGGAWLGHTALTERLTRSDLIFLQINLVLLLVVAFLPFPTRLIAEGHQEVDAVRVAATIYGLTLLTIRLLGAALDAYARREHLFSQEEDREELHSQRRLRLAVIAYVVAIVIGLFLPRVAVALYFAIALYLIVPLREVARLFRPS